MSERRHLDSILQNWEGDVCSKIQRRVSLEIGKPMGLEEYNLSRLEIDEEIHLFDLMSKTPLTIQIINNKVIQYKQFALFWYPASCLQYRPKSVFYPSRCICRRSFRSGPNSLMFEHPSFSHSKSDDILVDLVFF